MTQRGWSGTAATPGPGHQPRSRSIKALGRDPSTWSAIVGAVLVPLAALGMPFTPAGQAAAIAAMAMAMALVATTRPMAPGLGTGVVTASAALLTSYGMVLSDAAVAAVAGATWAIFTLLTRQRVEPKNTVVIHR